jgi:hypothetical protein
LSVTMPAAPRFSNRISEGALISGRMPAAARGSALCGNSGWDLVRRASGKNSSSAQ